MISTCEQDMICDLAETYHIFDYRSLPVKLVATLCAGLRDNSRSKLKLKNEKYPQEIVLLAMLVDRVAVLQHKLLGIKEAPVLVTDALFDNETAPKNQRQIKPDVFDTPEEFLARYKELTKGS